MRWFSDQKDFPAFFHHRKMTYRNFINTGISSIPEYNNPLMPLPRKMALRCLILEN
jgi:hypothetical protein